MKIIKQGVSLVAGVGFALSLFACSTQQVSENAAESTPQKQSAKETCTRLQPAIQDMAEASKKGPSQWQEILASFENLNQELAGASEDAGDAELKTSIDDLKATTDKYLKIMDQIQADPQAGVQAVQDSGIIQELSTNGPRVEQLCRTASAS